MYKIYYIKLDFKNYHYNNYPKFLLKKFRKL